MIPGECREAFLRFPGPVREEIDFDVVNDFLPADFVSASMDREILRYAQDDNRSEGSG
jgi:hypothetical protein